MVGHKIVVCQHIRIMNLKGQNYIINPFPSNPWFLCVCSTRLLITLREKEKLLTAISLFFQSFLPVWRTFFQFHQTQNYRLQTRSVWKSLNFVIWERVKLMLKTAGINTLELIFKCRTSVNYLAIGDMK